MRDTYKKMAQQRKLTNSVSGQIYFIYFLEIQNDELVFNYIVKHRHIMKDHSIEVNISVDKGGQLEKGMPFLESISVFKVFAAVVKRRFFSQGFIVYPDSI